jgi:hypothetical protein
MLTQISVFLENKEGKLARVLGILEDANINIRALSLADSTDFGMLRMIVDKPDEAKKALEEKHTLVSLNQVIGVVVPDRVGGLSGLLDDLSADGVSLEYMYSYLTTHEDAAYMVLRVEGDAFAVEKKLDAKGYRRAEQYKRLKRENGVLSTPFSLFCVRSASIRRADADDAAIHIPEQVDGKTDVCKPPSCENAHVFAVVFAGGIDGVVTEGFNVGI